MRNTIRLAALSATAVLALAACSTGNSSDTSSGTQTGK